MESPKVESRPAVSFAFDVAVELLLRGNGPGRYCHVDVQPWFEGRAFVSVWAGSDERSVSLAMQIGPPPTLLVTREDGASIGALSELAGGRTPTAVALDLARQVGVRLGDPMDCLSETRRWRWALLFRAAAAFIDRSVEPWQMWTTFHGGWGVHYLHFAPQGFQLGPDAPPVLGAFALSGEGHFACLPDAVSADSRCAHFCATDEALTEGEPVVAELLRVAELVLAAHRASR